MSRMLRRRLPVLIGILFLSFLVLSWQWTRIDPSPQPAMAQDEAPPSPTDHDAVRIDLHGDGRMDVGGKSTEVLHFSKAIMGLIEGDPEHVVLDLHCGADVSMEELHGYEKIFVAAGFTKVRFVDPKGTALAMVLPPPDIEEKMAGIAKEHVASVTLDAEGQLALDGATVSRRQLNDEVSKRLALDEKLVVSLTPEPTTHYADWVMTLAALKEAGAERLALLPPLPPRK